MRSFVKAAMLGAALLTVSGTGAASATPVCAGTDGTWYVCVDPIGAVYYSDWYYAGGSQCVPVAVPGPAGEICGGTVGNNVCKIYIDPVACPIFGSTIGNDTLRDCPPYDS